MKKHDVNGTLPIARPSKWDEMKRFLTTHYSVDPEYRGTVGIYTKRAGVRGGKFSLVRFYHADEVWKAIDELKFCKTNYYITANRFKDGKASMGSLFGFSNIVLDIDIHNGDWAAAFCRRKPILESLEFFLLEGFRDDPEYPAPNTIVRTGRGIQLWWALEPIHAGCRNMYLYVAERLMDRAQEIIDGTPSLEGLCKVDRAATKRMAGLFRMPGTFNTKSGRRGTFDVMHEDRISLPDTYCEMWERYGKENLKPGWTRAKGRPDSFLPIAAARDDALHALVRLRREGGVEPGDELRDLTMFVLCSSWLSAGRDMEFVKGRLASLNNEFVQPMPEHEYLAYMSTAARKKGYLISNKWIISQLGITEEEQEAIGLHEPGMSLEQREERSKKRKESDAARDEQIVRLCREGFGKKEIAEQVGCSAQTVSRVLKKKKLLTSKEALHNKVIAALKRGTPIKKILKKYGVSKSTVYELAKAVCLAAQKRKEKAEAVMERKRREGESAPGSGRQTEGKPCADGAMDGNNVGRENVIRPRMAAPPGGVPAACAGNACRVAVRKIPKVHI